MVIIVVAANTSDVVCVSNGGGYCEPLTPPHPWHQVSEIASQLIIATNTASTCVILLIFSCRMEEAVMKVCRL